MGTELDFWSLFTIVGLACITLITRSFFFLSNRDLKIPHWVERGLEYAPIAALAAVVAPEILMNDGNLVSHWWDAKLIGSLAGLIIYSWKKDVLFMIVGGMAVFLPLHIGLGW